MKKRSLILCVAALLLCALLFSCGKTGTGQTETDPGTTAPLTDPVTVPEPPTEPASPQTGDVTTAGQGGDETTRPTGSSSEEPNADLATDIFA